MRPGRELTAGNGEVVHFVVHDYTGRGDDELGAEEGVDGAGDGDGEARVVGGRDVGCAGAVEERAVLACEERNKSVDSAVERKKMNAWDQSSTVGNR